MNVGTSNGPVDDTVSAKRKASVMCRGRIGFDAVFKRTASVSILIPVKPEAAFAGYEGACGGRRTALQAATGSLFCRKWIRSMRPRGSARAAASGYSCTPRGPCLAQLLPPGARSVLLSEHSAQVASATAVCDGRLCVLTNCKTVGRPKPGRSSLETFRSPARLEEFPGNSDEGGIFHAD